MKVLFRSIAALLVLVGVFLIYAVIHALGSDGGARAGVAVGYVVGALVLGFAATKLWNAGTKGSGTAQA
jgi:hypothetical protein